MLLEIHAHTAEHSSCSSVSAKDLVQRIFMEGLDGIAFTDHHYLWPLENLEPLHSAAEVPKDFLILSGQEVSTDFGDMLVFGADRTFPRNTRASEIRRSCPEAALVWAHPYRGGQFPPDEKLRDGILDAVEIFNSNHTVRGNTRGLRDWHRLRFIATSGTDTHAASYAGVYPTVFFHQFRTIEEMASEIRHGRCVPLLSETSHFGASARVTELQMGRREGGEPQERLIIRSAGTPEQWQASSRSFAVMEALAEHGFGEGQFRVPRPIENDRGSEMAIEQALGGRSLFDELLTASRLRGEEVVRLAAMWLVRLHNARLVITKGDEFIPSETQRMARYLENFSYSQHPHTMKFREILDAVLEEERQIAAHEPDSFVQGHGDFHPKNILIGDDKVNGRDDTSWIAAIDFEKSMVQPRALDVGYFLAQFRNQFHEHREVLRSYPESLFIDRYLESAGADQEDFRRQVYLFKARTNLSIASYLLGVGLGQTEKLWRVLVEAEQGIAMYRAARMRGQPSEDCTPIERQLNIPGLGVGG